RHDQPHRPATGIGSAAFLADRRGRARRPRRPPRTVMRELTRLAPVRRRALIIVACGLVLAGCGGKTVSPVPQPVVGKVPTTPQAKGDRAAGKKVFASAGCAGCHTLKDAGATGNVGP